MTVAYPIVGIDISSTALDCAILDADGKFQASSTDNSKAAARKLARGFAKRGVALVVVESTGGYENVIMAALAAEGMPLRASIRDRSATSPKGSASLPKPILLMLASSPSSASAPGHASPRCQVHKKPD